MSFDNTILDNQDDSRKIKICELRCEIQSRNGGELPNVNILQGVPKNGTRINLIMYASKKNPHGIFFLLTCFALTYTAQKI